MEIKPTYVTFEQAKLFLTKGIRCETNKSYVYRFKEHEDKGYNPSLTDKPLLCDIPAPEQWQVVEWLRVNHGIWVSVDMVYEVTQTGFWYSIRQSKEDDMAIGSNEYPTPQQAYSAAFDYIKNNNLI